MLNNCNDFSLSALRPEDFAAGVLQTAESMIDFRVNFHFLLGSCPLVEFCLFDGPEMKVSLTQIIKLFVSTKCGKCMIKPKYA